MTEPRNDDLLIRMFHVYKRYGPKLALADLTLDIMKNEFLLVCGPSGAGKSTLLKLLYMGEEASQGQIIIDGQNLARVGHRNVPYLRRKFGIIFQDYKLIPTKTVFHNIALVLEASGQKRSYIQKKVGSVLRTVGMEDRQNSYPPSLSGGEQQRIAIARAVVGDPSIILADEPTGSLDAESAAGIVGLLKGFHTRGATIIIATHDRELIRNTSGRVIYLKHGQSHTSSTL